MPGVAKIGDDGADALGRGAFERIDHDQQLHQVVVGRGAGGLDNENVARAHVLLDFDGDFAIGEAAHIGIAQGCTEVVGDFFGHATVGIAGKHHEIRG